MKLFTVSEPVPGDGIVKPGIDVLPNESPMGLRWGATTPAEMKVLPLCKAQYRAVRGALEAGLIDPESPCRLVRADIANVKERPRFEIERDERDQRAFIYICTSTAAGEAPRGSTPEDAMPNAVTLTSNNTLHISEGTGPRDRVRWVYKPFSEAEGIERIDVALLTAGGATWNEALLVLQPGASFRVVRGGDVQDLVPEFLVIWTGHKLKTVVHDRYRDRLESMAMTT